jgi:oxidoreductase
MIGFGWVAQKVWLPLLQEADVELVSVIDPSPDARAALGACSPGSRVHAVLSADALSGCTLAFICSPNIHHVEQAVFALTEGLHVVLEKPACFSLAEADLLIGLSQQRRRGLWLTAASSHRSDVCCLRDQIEQGALGTVYCIEAGWRRKAGVPLLGSWFTRADSALVGSGGDLGWHILEVGLALLDYPMIRSGFSHQVCATDDVHQSHATWRNDIPAPFEGELSVDTQLYGSLLTETGAVVQVSTAWASHQTHDETFIRAYGQDGELALHATFGFSTNTVTSPYVSMTRRGNREMLTYPAEDKMAPYRAFMRCLLERARHAETGGEDISTDYSRLRSLASAMSALYPGLASSIAEGAAMCRKNLAEVMSCE